MAILPSKMKLFKVLKAVMALQEARVFKAVMV